MTRSSTRKAHPHPESGLEMSPVVRAAKVIPAMPRLSQVQESLDCPPQVSRCTGRCGHCDIHPCQLHPSV